MEEQISPFDAEHCDLSKTLASLCGFGFFTAEAAKVVAFIFYRDFLIDQGFYIVPSAFWFRERRSCRD